MKRQIILIAGSLLLVGCHGAKPTIDNTTVQTGPRFDEDRKFIDAPEVTVPVWSSTGLKEKPEDKDIRPER